MCFSANASFATAAVTSAIGLLALSRIRGPREIPLAAVPLVFAVQQSLEGLLWLKLPGAADPAMTGALTLAYLAIAQVFWPVFTPVAAMLIEPRPRRRRWMFAALALGAGVAAYCAWGLFDHPPVAAIASCHIAYGVSRGDIDALSIGYLLAVCAPLLLSSHRAIVALGVVVAIGAVTAYAFYLQAFQSVWCYFSAAASIVIVAHFEDVRRSARRLALAWTPAA
jgi:hypothetical protein